MFGSQVRQNLGSASLLPNTPLKNLATTGWLPTFSPLRTSSIEEIADLAVLIALQPKPLSKSDYKKFTIRVILTRKGEHLL